MNHLIIPSSGNGVAYILRRVGLILAYTSILFLFENVLIVLIYLLIHFIAPSSSLFERSASLVQGIWNSFLAVVWIRSFFVGLPYLLFYLMVLWKKRDPIMMVALNFALYMGTVLVCVALIPRLLTTPTHSGAGAQGGGGIRVFLLIGFISAGIAPFLVRFAVPPLWKRHTGIETNVDVKGGGVST